MKLINRFNISRNWKCFIKDKHVRKINSFKDKKEIEMIQEYYYDSMISNAIQQIGNIITTYGFSDLKERQIDRLEVDLLFAMKELIREHPATVEKDVQVTVIPRLPYIKNRNRYSININSSFMAYNTAINKNIVCIYIDIESTLFGGR